jgi:hypothetical protein
MTFPNCSAPVCSCIFWGTLFQVAVAPVQWAMAKGHTVSKAVIYQMHLHHLEPWICLLRYPFAYFPLLLISLLLAAKLDED